MELDGILYASPTEVFIIRASIRATPNDFVQSQTVFNTFYPPGSKNEFPAKSFICKIAIALSLLIKTAKCSVNLPMDDEKVNWTNLLIPLQAIIPRHLLASHGRSAPGLEIYNDRSDGWQRSRPVVTRRIKEGRFNLETRGHFIYNPSVVTEVEC